ncbi:hypothetical protein [Streptomyces sp. NPDC088915]|uniref:hypothetical protein n=1 Tax=Streptomyces sp. NPDC088915 TaxID=3365912 RepID=UPI003808E1C3
MVWIISAKVRTTAAVIRAPVARERPPRAETATASVPAAKRPARGRNRRRAASVVAPKRESGTWKRTTRALLTTRRSGARPTGASAG